jgi:hypothetical protein
LKPSQPKEISQRKAEIQEEKDQHAPVEDNFGYPVKTLPRNTPKKAGGKPIKKVTEINFPVQIKARF